MNAVKLLKLRRVRQKENRASVPKWRMIKFDLRSKKKGLTSLIFILLAVFISTAIHISVARVSVAQPKVIWVSQEVPIRIERVEKEKEKLPEQEVKQEPITNGTGVASNTKPRDTGTGGSEGKDNSKPSGGLGEMLTAMAVDSKLFDGSAIDETLEKDLANLNGPTGFDARGTSGLGQFGAGQGGGGRVVGINGPWNSGKGRCRGSDCGIGAPNGSGKTGDFVPPDKKDFGQGTAYSSDYVQQVIMKHLNIYRNCYQKELNRNPNLYGKITVKFIINSEGHVAMATLAHSTMGNSSVEDCMIRVTKTLLFIPPKGNSSVVVNYPFIFKSRQ